MPEGVTVADEPSAAEIAWRLQAHEERTDRVHAALDVRVTDLARDAVAVGMWQQAERARDTQQQQAERARDIEIGALRDRVRDLEDDLRRRDRAAEAADQERARERSRDRRLVIAAVVSPLLLLVVQIYLTGKGG